MNCHLPECNRAILFLQWLDICFGIVHTKFHDPRWKIMAPKNLQSFLFLLKKTIYGTQLSSVAEATIFHLGSQNFMCTISKLYIYLPTAKFFALAQSGRWQFQFEVRSVFPPDIWNVTFNALTVVTDYFFKFFLWN